MNASVVRCRRYLARSLLTIPAVVVIIIALLGMLRLSGSSIALHDESDPSSQATLQPRPNRNDEWQQRTPMVIRQAELGFPSTTDMGIGVHDAGVLSDLPVKSFSAVIKPHSWVYFVFGVERAFALEWWLVVLGPFLGVYALLAAITRERLIPALSGLLVAASPVAAWWAIPSMGLSVLYGGLTAALLVLALRHTGSRRLVLSALAGWTASCFAALLYIPWLLPLSLIFGLVVISQARGVFRDRRQLLTLVGGFGAVFAVLMAGYFKQHQAAIQAISNTVYPGSRITPSGEAIQALAFNAPFDVFTTVRPFVFVNGTNETEASSGLMLWLPIAFVGGAFSGWRSRQAGARALAAVMSAAMVLAAWAFFPVPERLGALIGLTKVQGSRLVLPLTVAGALAAGLYVHRLRTDGSFRPARSRVVVGTVAFLFVTGLAAAAITIDKVRPDSASILILLIVSTLLIAAILGGRVILGLGGACALLLFSTVRVNPLQIGLGPVTHDPLLAQIDSVRDGDSSARWATLGLNGHTRSILMASGAPTATGVSWYPDPDGWHRIDPTDFYEPRWNRFALVSIAYDPAISDVEIDLTADDAVLIRTPLCDGALQQLAVKYVIADDPMDASCLEVVDQPSNVGERWIYRVG